MMSCMRQVNMLKNVLTEPKLNFLTYSAKHHVWQKSNVRRCFPPNVTELELGQKKSDFVCKSGRDVLQKMWR